MNLKHILLYQYRNYDRVSVYFNDGIHILYGKNAQGKTNMLEAIHYISTTRSHRSTRDADLIKEGMNAFFIEALIEKENIKEEMEIRVNEMGKQLFIYHNPIRRVSDFIGEFNAVMFCPDDMSLFTASPRVRRRFVDMELSKISKKYVTTLFTAQKLLKERNAYLKLDHDADAYLAVLTAQLIDAQVIIMKQRYFFLEQIIAKCQLFYRQLSNDHTDIQLRYDSCVAFTEDEASLRKKLHETYQQSLQRDKLWKVTSTGIHKEDYIFYVNDKEVSTYASQGQKRSILLALKVGMIHMIHDMIHEYPVLLLDDVFSELDPDRRQALLQALPKEVQIFISTTDITEIRSLHIAQNVTVWNVQQGRITEM